MTNPPASSRPSMHHFEYQTHENIVDLDRRSARMHTATARAAGATAGTRTSRAPRPAHEHVPILIVADIASRIKGPSGPLRTSGSRRSRLTFAEPLTRRITAVRRRGHSTSANVAVPPVDRGSAGRKQHTELDPLSDFTTTCWSTPLAFIATVAEADALRLHRTVVDQSHGTREAQYRLLSASVTVAAARLAFPFAFTRSTSSSSSLYMICVREPHGDWPRRCRARSPGRQRQPRPSDRGDADHRRRFTIAAIFEESDDTSSRRRSPQHAHGTYDDDSRTTTSATRTPASAIISHSTRTPGCRASAADRQIQVPRLTT